MRSGIFCGEMCISIQHTYFVSIRYEWQNVWIGLTPSMTTNYRDSFYIGLDPEAAFNDLSYQEGYQTWDARLDIIPLPENFERFYRPFIYLKYKGKAKG